MDGGQKLDNPALSKLQIDRANGANGEQMKGNTMLVQSFFVLPYHREESMRMEIM
jgi:hypothetical protein